MKKHLIYITTAMALVLAGAAAPASAMSLNADLHASTDVQVGSSSTGTHVEASDEANEGSGRGLLKGILDKHEDVSSSTVRAKLGNASSTTAIAKAKTRADQEIDRRIENLNKLSARVNEMTKVSAAEKTTLSAQIQTEITTLTNLKAKIDADTDATVLKTDVQSITSSYRVYALVMPQIALMAAADRVNALVSSFNTLASKLQTRITAAQAAGKDMSASVTALADLNAKISDASVQATAAVSAVASLTPDNGDKTKQDANKAAMKAAEDKIKAANNDLKAARKDAESIIKATKGFGVNASSTASTTVSH